MKVLVTVARTPFVASAAGARGAALTAHLAATEGVSAELMTLPSCPRDSERMLDEAALAALLRTVNADRMIALNFPACLLPCPATIVWIGADEDLPPPPGSGRDGDIAAALARATTRAFARAERLFCASAALVERVEDRRAELLAVPEDDAGWAAAVARLIA